jgi:hypothetical protein
LRGGLLFTVAPASGLDWRFWPSDPAQHSAPGFLPERLRGDGPPLRAAGRRPSNLRLTGRATYFWTLPRRSARQSAEYGKVRKPGQAL